MQSKGRLRGACLYSFYHLTLEITRHIADMYPAAVALCMNRLGFEARRIRNVRGWNVVILTGNDIKEHQRLNAHRSVED